MENLNVNKETVKKHFQ